MNYSYTLRTTAGKLEKGTLQANTYNDALLRVRKLGGTVIHIQNVAEKKPLSFGSKRLHLSLKERIVFTEQLAVMLKAGITLVQALKGIEEESSNKTLRLVVGKLVTDVESGISYSAALAKQTGVFSNIYCQMVKSAEKTGNLSDILDKLKTQQQKEYELKGKVQGALIYPAIISVLLVGVVIMVITYILPKLSGMFTESGVQLPASTRFLLWLSYVMTHDWYILVGGIIALVVGFKLMVKTAKGRLFWDTYKLKIPVLGSFMKKSYMARLTQSFASLAQAGVPVLEIFETLRGVVGNALYEQEITKISKDVANGITISTAIRKSKHFPSMIGQLVSVGEQSGDLAGIFTTLGEFFEKEVDDMAKNLSTLLEPIIMIVMGVGIGFVLVSILQPIYGLVNAT